MARLVQSPTGSGPQGPFERVLVDHLRTELADSYQLIPNFSLKDANQPPLEYDVVVVAPHALYVIEAKEWYGRVSGDDTEWLINRTPKKCPMWLLTAKCKVLKSHIGALGQHVWVEPLLVVPDNTVNSLEGNWARSVVNLGGAVAHLTDPQRVRFPRDIQSLHGAVISSLLGRWGARRRDERRRIGGFEVVETLAAAADSAEYLAKRALVDDPARFRIRTWRVDPYAPADQREQRLAVIRRPTEALAKIGRHPNLLPVLDFYELAEESEFYEVTEWSEFGTLHGYLRNADREPLTLRERLEIAAGVACALEAVHEHQVVHRNVCPASVLIGFDRQPRLTNFDRAYVESRETVFVATDSLRNIAYLPPELEDKTDYDFDTCSDMYSFGVLLYELFTDEVPFKDPGEARRLGGMPAAPASAIRGGLDARLDGFVQRLLNVEDFRARPTATEALTLLRDILGGSSDQSSDAASPAGEPPTGPPSFEIGSVIDGVFRIDAPLGSGGFSRVYRVYHLDHLETYAMKLLRDGQDVNILLHEYTQVGRRLPAHPNIARMIWMGRLSPPAGTPYILSEFVDGDTLEPYCDGRKQLPWTDIRRIAIDLLNALDAFHPPTAKLAVFRAEMSKRSLTDAEFTEYQDLQQQVDDGILHRDIKPANILLELPSHRAKLIDFNIASKLVSASGRGGTPRYWAPDRGQPDWRADMDLFSLGVVLYELVTHNHPFEDARPEAGEPADPRRVRDDLKLGTDLAKFLLKAVQPIGAERFQSAAEMRAALEAVPHMHAPATIPIQSRPTFTGITLAPEEVGRADYNPYVTRLLTLYSQARRTNAGTRGLDEIARITYVKTRLDERLAPTIADGRFRLVVVTGNAGDGKTAFLQQIEEQFRQVGVAVQGLPSLNGSRWARDGLTYETNYDGSQDEGSIENDSVLARFLGPFAHSLKKGLDGSGVRILAINEGRLLDFLDHSEERADFAELRRLVHRALAGQDPVPDRFLLVNLNLRSVAAGGPLSLVDRQLGAMLQETLWEPCETCSIRERCPIKHNADTLRDGASGPEVRARIRRLFETVHLRRRAHVTMRDLRSTLSWLLLRDQGCDDVARILHDQPNGDALLRLYYTEAFGEPTAQERRTVEDRLVRLLREADVGLGTSALLDQRLDHDPQTAVPWMTFEKRSTHAWRVLVAKAEAMPRSLQDMPLDRLLTQRRGFVASLRRWAYFERRDEAWRAMVPYRALPIHEAVIAAQSVTEVEAAAGSLRDRVVEAVSMSEGLRNPELRRHYLALRASRQKAASIKSYRLFPKDSFSIEVPRQDRFTEFLEYAPDAVDLIASGGRARLRLTLDLLEMLELIRLGYRPSPSDLQGLFVNLSIFRNELLNLPYDRVMLTTDDDALYELSADYSADVGIRLALSRHRSETFPGKEPRP